MLTVQNVSDIPSSKWSAYAVISLDFFDTLVVRKQSESTLLLNAIKSLLHEQGIVADESELLSLFESTTNDFRNSAISAGFDGEAYLLDICKQVFGDSPLSLEDGFTERFYRNLIQQEQENLVLAEGVNDWLIQLHDFGKKVIVVSDTYYRQTDISRFLRELGIEEYISHVYASSDVRLNKASGRLFEYVLKQEQINANGLLHIGDNRYSDITMAQKHGIQACFVKTNSIVQQSEIESQLFYFGYQTLAPVIACFIDALNCFVKEQGLKRLHFLARDGYLLHQAALLLMGDDTDTGLKTDYVYLNRITANQLTTLELSRQLLTMLSIEHTNQGIYGLVSALGLYGGPFESTLNSWLTQHNLNSNTLLSNEVIEQLLSDTDLIQSFNNEIKSKRQRVRQYLFDLFSVDKKQCFVDVGWRGTIVEKIKPIFEQKEQSHLILGYLLACSESSRLEGELFAFIADAPLLAEYREAVVELREVIEYCCAEAQSLCIGIDKNSKPEFKAPFTFSNSDDARAIIQCGVLSKLKIAKKFHKTWDAKEAIQQLVSVCQQPTEELMKAFGSVEVSVSINDNSKKTLDTFLLAKQQHDKQEMKNTQSGIYNFLAFTKELTHSNDTIYLYGAGSGCQFLLPYLIGNKVVIFDSNKNLHGQEVNQHKVVSADKMMEYLQPKDTLLITVLGRKQQISHSLAKAHLDLVFLEDFLW